MKTSNAWTPITAEQYEEYLCVLPPRIMTDAGFLVGEPFDHDSPEGLPRYGAYVQHNGSYWYAGVMTVREFRNIPRPPQGEEQ